MASDELQHRHSWGRQAGPIHQVAEDHSVCHTCKEAWADQEHGLDEACCHVAQSRAFTLPSEDRVRHDGGADVGNDQDELEDRAQSHARGWGSALTPVT